MEDSKASKTRSSTRTKKLSKSMKVVDAETRRQVMKDRLDALEGDTLFDTMKENEAGDQGLEEYVLNENDDEVFKTDTPKEAEKKRTQNRIQNTAKRVTRNKMDIQTFDEWYLSCAARPSIYPQRHF